MSGRLKVEEINVGGIHEATFYPNPVADSGFRFRATHLDGKRAPKVVLCNDDRIPPACPARCASPASPASTAVTVASSKSNW